MNYFDQNKNLTFIIVLIMKLALFLSIIFISCTTKNFITMNNDPMPTANHDTPSVHSNSIHTFKIAGLSGDSIDFNQFKGKKILIVNVASECGYTPQYSDLQKLADTYKDKLVVVGIPANNFGSQEPGTNEEIKTFCQKNYGVTFPMASKLSAKGADIAPIFKFLCLKSENGISDATIEWNFSKFLIDEQGKWMQSFPSNVKPLDEAITSKI